MKISRSDKVFLKDVIDYLQFQGEMPLHWENEEGEVTQLILPGIIDELLEKQKDVERFKRLYIEYLNESTANAKRIIEEQKSNEKNES